MEAADIAIGSSRSEADGGEFLAGQARIADELGRAGKGIGRGAAGFAQGMHREAAVETDILTGFNLDAALLIGADRKIPGQITIRVGTGTINIIGTAIDAQRRG